MDVALVGLVLAGVENLSLAVLSDAVERAGMESTIVPLSGWADIDAATAAVLRRRPRVCGISIQTGESALASLAFARVLRARGYAGTIVSGGHFATLNAADILRSPAGIDAVVRFAGEEALVGLARGASGESALGALPGLVYRARGGEIRVGAPARVGNDVPRAPARAADLPEHLGFAAADLVSSRGCLAHCGYCDVAAASDLARREADRAGGPNRDAAYARRPIEAIAGEMAMLWHERRARVFNFMDDNLLPVDAAEALRWLAELRLALDRRRVGRLALSMQIRADIVTSEVAEALAELGLVRAYVGIDAFSGGQLRTLGRAAPADAGPVALDRLGARGVFCVCNALVIGPTFEFDSVRAEIEALECIRGAPMHLLPIDARAGTVYAANAERRGLVEGGFLFRRYRFEDERTELLARVVTSMPTRLAEHSVPIALYDLGYNLGIARRLVPEADIARASAAYRSVASAWNADQLRLLRVAAEVAAAGDRRAIEALILEEQPRVRAHDEALLRECYGALSAVERAVSATERRRVRAHARGQLLSAVGLSMALSACGASTGLPGIRDAGPDVTADAEAGACPDGRTPQDTLQILFSCNVDCAITLRFTFDADGVVAGIARTDGIAIDPVQLQCLEDFFRGYCYPSLAGTSMDYMPTCWIA